MKLIRNKADGTGYILESDATSIDVHKGKFRVSGVTYQNLKEFSHELVLGVSEPEHFIEGVSKYIDGIWSEVDQASYDASEAKKIEGAKSNLIAEIKKARTKAMFTDVTVPFPADEETVQFRNPTDQGNLQAKVTGAMALVIAGTPTAQMKFTVANNDEVSMEAQELMSAGMAILAEKDSVYYSYKALKDAAQAATTTEELLQVETDLKAL